MNTVNRIRLALGMVSAAILGALLAVTLVGQPVVTAEPAPVPVASETDANPWVFTMTDGEAEGMRVNCPDSENVTQCFIVYDYLNQPISGVNSAGAALWWAGDFANGYRGSLGANAFDSPMLQMDTERAVPPSAECLGLVGIEGKGWWGEGGLYQCKVGGYGFYWDKVSN